MSFEIAASHAAHLMAIAPIDPFAPSPCSSAGHSLWSLVEGIDLASMHESAGSAVEQFEAQSPDKMLRVSRVIGGSDVRALAAKAAEADLVLVPANVELDGNRAQVWSEVAEFLVRRGLVAILRVARKPLDVKRVVLVVSSTERCSQLAGRYLELDLWSQASVSILPVGDYRPRASENVRKQLEHLQTGSRNAALLPPIDLDFEAEDLERILPPFQAAVMGHLHFGAGWFDAVRYDPFEIVASRVPVVLVP